MWYGWRCRASEHALRVETLKRVVGHRQSPRKMVNTRGITMTTVRCVATRCTGCCVSADGVRCANILPGGTECGAARCWIGPRIREVTTRVRSLKHVSASAGQSASRQHVDEYFNALPASRGQDRDCLEACSYACSQMLRTRDTRRNVLLRSPQREWASVRKGAPYNREAHALWK